MSKWNSREKPLSCGCSVFRRKRMRTKDGKRRDNKGRVLNKGENQRSDGLYMFRYTDAYGKRK